MLFDTDILIWIQRGHLGAARLVDNAEHRFISIQTYMELLQCAPSKKHLLITKQFLADFEFKILPLTENIGHRAAVYIEEYSHKAGLRAGDALIAATAVENNVILATSNAKHFSPIKPLSLELLRVAP